MAFEAAPGWGNLPKGNFVPVVYSQKVLKFFRRVSVVEDITNTDYTGEIANFGDTVKIIKEPTITIADLKRGQRLETQWIDDDEIVMLVDQAKYFQFAVDDIETKQTHINWESLATESAAYSLKDDFDRRILTHIHDNYNVGDSDFEFGSTGSPLDVGFDAGETSPLAVMNRLARLMDDQNIPTENRWFVAPPVFWEQVQDENSKLISVDYATPGNIIRNGKVTSGEIRGFTCYKSNNLPNTATYNVALAGHMSAVATATQLADIEMFRSQEFFGDVVRGKHLYGRKVLRPEALVASHFTVD